MATILSAENAGAQDAVGVHDADTNLGAGGSGVKRDDRKLSVQRRGAPIGAERGTGVHDRGKLRG